MPGKPWSPGRRDRRVLLAILSGASNLSLLTVSRVAQVSPRRAALTMAQLEGLGWIDRLHGHGTGPPRRRFYWVTSTGRAAVMSALGLEDDRG